MVRLTRIYTRGGDKGETSLGDGSRVPKDHSRIAAYGTVDELNAVLGLLRADPATGPEGDLIASIQNDLFDVGADLCVPQSSEGKSRLRVTPEQAERLEQAIDRINGQLSELTSFILPGGCAAASWCHLARTVCRRAEREVVALSHQEPLNPQVIIYLNRLSDLLFVMSREFNDWGKKDILWQPGKSQKEKKPN